MQGDTKLQEVKVRGPERKFKNVTEKAISIRKRVLTWVQQVIFCEFPTVISSSSSFVSPWATQMHNHSIENLQNVWMVQYIVKSVSALLTSDISLQSTHIYVVLTVVVPITVPTDCPKRSKFDYVIVIELFHSQKVTLAQLQNCLFT